MRPRASMTALWAGLLVASISVDLGALDALGEGSSGDNSTCCTPAIIAPAIGGDGGCTEEGDICTTDSCEGTRSGAVQGGNCEPALSDYQCTDGFTRTYEVEVVALQCGSVDDGCPCESTPIGTTEVTVTDDCTGDLCP